jgi:hypothetical protein
MMLIDALSRSPLGIQISCFKGNYYLRLGYCGMVEFNGPVLDQVLYRAYGWVYNHPDCPHAVRVALEAINSRGSTSQCFEDIKILDEILEDTNTMVPDPDWENTL